MRVLQVINSLHMGGAEVLLSNLAPEFERRGIDLTVWVLRASDGPLSRKLEANKVPVIHSGEKRLRSWKQINLLGQHLSEHDYDIVHAHLFPSQLFVPLAARRVAHKPKLITTEHSTHNRRRKLPLRPLERWIYSQYDVITCISDGVLSSLQQWLQLPNVPFRRVSNGVPLSHFDNTTTLDRKALVGDSRGAIVLMVGSFRKPKDHFTLLRAAAGLPVQVVLVGSGPLQDEVKRLATELNMSDCVHFLGTRNDVNQILPLADVYVQSSQWEGFGIAALEAMASGIAVVGSNVPGLSEVVGDAGLLFEVGDEHGLRACLKALISDRDLRRSYALKGMSRARTFSIESVTEAYIETYKMSLSNKSSM